MIIQVDVSAGTAVLRKECVLTVGMVGAQTTFNFGSHWQGLSRTAVFRQGNVTRDVVGITDRCAIPPEVLAQPGLPVEIGVYGFDADGKLVIPTVWVKTAPVHPGANPSGDESTDTTLPVWQQILNMIGDTELLTDSTIIQELQNIDQKMQALDDDIAESVVNLTHAKITVTKTGDAYTANMTYEEVSTALAEGRTLYCSYGGLRLPYLRSITAGPHVFACIDGTDSCFVQILPSEVLFDHKILATQKEIPDTLPNPHKLTFTGAVEAVYDGSEAVTVSIPSGTDKDVLLLADRQTGRVYRLFAENGQLKMTAGDGIGGMDCVTLTDRQTGRVYELFVHDGELKMTE